jgi:hypothetical protein
LSRSIGPNVQVTETGDPDYPFKVGFYSSGEKGESGHLPGNEVYLTTAQAMTLVSRLAPLLGFVLAPPRPDREGE